MTAEQLRNSILQEAISGRLVPQDPNDEPASALLQRIREEKARLVKEGKLKKKDLEETPIAEDEITFEIPKGWEWSRWGNLAFSIMYGYNAPAEDSGDIRMVRIIDIQGNKVLWDKVPFCRINPKDIDAYLLRPNDILFARTGGTVGKSYIVTEVPYPSIYAGYLIRTQYSKQLCPHYLKYFMESQLYWSQLRDETIATAQPNCNGKKLAAMILPIPPLAEQKRIVAKLEELLPIVEQYGKAQKELDELNAALPSRLRQSILQEAISGKLVPQDENETAEGLKEQLLQAVNSSPLKKKWNSEPIEEDELPFDIPENWKWIRLGDIVYTQTGLSYSKGDLEKKVPNPIRVLRGGNIQNGSWCTKDDDVMIAPEFVKKDIFLKKNSFITPAVTSLEHLGKTALIREDHNDIVAGGFVLYLMPYDDKNDSLMEYLAYFFQSAFYNSFCKTITNKSGQAFWNISREKLLKLAIPLPPLAEQQRIVAKIEELFEQIEKISK